MKPSTIIWDFDGTLLPNDPYDSEQSLMMYKLNEAGSKIPILSRTLARFLIYADNREQLRKTFKRYYTRFLLNTPVFILDRVSKRLAEKIPPGDRQALLQLKARGHRMLVLSCGTADLSERVLNAAGLSSCFEGIEGNRFKINNGRIAGMRSCVPNPEDKVRYLIQHNITAATAVAIGDGYTDIPLLDWAGMAMMIDKTGEKKRRYAHKNYRFISSVPEVLNAF
jgi:phosphoserine phosphatase